MNFLREPGAVPGDGVTPGCVARFTCLALWSGIQMSLCSFCNTLFIISGHVLAGVWMRRGVGGGNEGGGGRERRRSSRLAESNTEVKRRLFHVRRMKTWLWLLSVRDICASQQISSGTTASPHRKHLRKEHGRGHPRSEGSPHPHTKQ